MSYPVEMKSMNCISHTGRMPMWAAPAAAPMIAASEIGVSITRCSPYFAAKPSVTLNAPPYAPMSSPRQKTFLSRSISSNNASRIASRYVISDIVRSPTRRALVDLDCRLDSLSEPERRDHRGISVNADKRIGGIGHRRCFRLVGGAVDLVLHSRDDRVELCLRKPFAEQPPDVPVDRIVLFSAAVHLAAPHL